MRLSLSSSVRRLQWRARVSREHQVGGRGRGTAGRRKHVDIDHRRDGDRDGRSATAPGGGGATSIPPWSKQAIGW